MPCVRCGAALGAAGSHPLCCALPEATRGHYGVRDEVLALAHLADPTAAVESVGLVPSVPELRPADILTSAAFPGRLAALDIGVTSPDRSGAGEDCCDSMHQRKLGDYGHVLAELEEQGVTYRPMVWSCFGRCHPEAQAILATMATRVARRRGLRGSNLVLRRVRTAIGVELVRRAVNMVRACLPQLAAEEERLMFGEGDASHPIAWPRPVCMSQGDAHVPAAAAVASGATLAASSGAALPAPSALSRPAALQLVFGRGPSRGVVRGPCTGTVVLT